MSQIHIGLDNRRDPLQFGGDEYIACLVTPDEEDQQWREVTQEGLEDYLHHHDADGYDALTRTVMELYEGVIAKYALQCDARAALDVGCGVGRQRPIYVRKLPSRIDYLGLDPIWVNEDRAYDFLCAKVEDLNWLNIQNRYDLALFATSLDHFLDVDIALNAVKKVMNKGGYMIFWVGLHDSHLVAEMAATRAFAHIFAARSLFKRMGLLAKWVAIELPRLLVICFTRGSRLRKGKPLDRFHFHYFLEANMAGMLSAHGELVETIRLPGTNSLFIVVKV